MQVLISYFSREVPLVVLSKFISKHEFMFDQLSIKIGGIVGFFIASLGQILVFFRSFCACVYIYFDLFIHIKYEIIRILFSYIFCSNLNGSPKSVSSPTWLFGSGQERCSYPLADAFNGWYQSPQESMEVWMRYSGLMID